jgi:repressor LexA
MGRTPNPDKRAAVYRAVVRYLETNGFSPTIRELGEELGMAHSSVGYFLGQLREMGEVTWQENKNRSIRLTEKAVVAEERGPRRFGH